MDLVLVLQWVLFLPKEGGHCPVQDVPRCEPAPKKGQYPPTPGEAQGQEGGPPLGPGLGGQLEQRRSCSPGKESLDSPVAPPVVGTFL